MLVLKYIGRFLNTLADRIVSVLGALVFSQAPQFFEQYLRVLEGALAEARRNLAEARTKAAELGLTLEQFIDAHLRNNNPIFRKSGEVYQAAVERMQDYEGAYQSLSQASVWERPFSMLLHFDSDLFSAMHFTPGLPLTTEGLIYALIGVLFALGVYHGILRLPFHIINRRRAGRPAVSASGKPEELEI